MMLRVLVAAALVGLPFLVSGALAQSPAIPADSSCLACYAGEPAKRPPRLTAW